MYNLLLSLFLIYNLIGAQAWAQSDNIRLRPTYKRFYSICKSDLSFFKSDLLLSTYSNTVSSMFFMLSDAREFTAFVNSKFVNSNLSAMLKNPSFIYALSDCIPNEQERNTFVKQLLTVEAAGKFVGISMIPLLTVSMKRIFPYLKSSLSFLPAPLLNKIITTTSITLSALYLWKLKQEFYEEDLREIKDTEIIPDWKASFRNKGIEQLQHIETLLEDPLTDNADRAKLIQQKSEWETSLARLK